MGYWDREWEEEQRMKGAGRREVEAAQRALWRYGWAFAAWFVVLWLAGGLRGWGDLGLIALGAWGSVRIAEIWREGDEASQRYSTRQGR